MNKNYLKTIVTLIFALIISNSFAQTSKDGLWNLIPSKEVSGEKVRRSSFPNEYHLFQLNLNLLKSKLVNAPVLFSNTNQAALIIEFPNSEGNFETFKVYESSIMDPILEAKFPMIKTYAAQGIDDPTATMRFSVTQFGLHTMSLSGIKSTNYIDPFTTDLATYIVYDRNGLGSDPQEFTCLTDESVSLPSLEKNSTGNLAVQNINDQKLRTFRLAQSCTGEYGAIFKGTTTVTATQKANVQAQMAITMNRVNGVFERDLSIHMNFIADNDLLIYTDATTDPWTNEWNTKTAQTIDAAIGVTNYDIGHNFNTTGGGSAGCLSCVCLSSSQSSTHKGRGYTGRSNPTGDAFDIDYVAHEMGHQYGGYHVMNTCSRSGNGTTEVEPASGSSIMGYAGICTTNVQSNSDDDFNYVNVRDISVNIKTGNSTCAAITTLTNTPPTANAGLDYTIPKSTPYILEGTATDVDGLASLTHNWSQNDPTRSPGSAAPLTTYSVGPLYRSIKPSISPNRYMPALSTVLANLLSTTWEKTPSVARTMNFSYIVRDNSVGGGQTASDLMKVTVDGVSGPFAVTSQSTLTTWTATTIQTITWNEAGTSSGAVNTPSVNIYFSANGTFTDAPIPLALGILNNGSATITVPSVTTTTGRFMIRGAGNIFYDLNNAKITIVASPSIAPVSNFSVANSNPCTASNIQLNDQSLNAPNSWTWTATSSTGVSFSNANSQNPTVTFANSGTYTISLIAENAIGNNTSDKTITVNETPTVAVNSSTICSGNSTVLTALGATSFSWSNGASIASVSVSPTTSANYTVTGTSNGCTNSKVSNVTVNTNPIVSLVMTSSLICTSDGTVSLNGTPAGGNFTGTGVAGNYFDPSASGTGSFTITYSYTDANSCISNDNKPIVVDLCSGINELLNNSFALFPNPTSGNFIIDFKLNSIENTSLEIYDAIGKIVITQAITNNITNVSLDQFAKGIYSVRIKNDNSYIVIRVIKE